KARIVCEEIVGGFGSNQEEGVVQSSSPVLNLPKTIRHIRLWIGRAIEDFRAIHGQATGSFRERSFHADYTAQTSDLGVSHRKECIQAIAGELDPLVPYVIGHGGV